MSDRFAGKVALVTGASSGLGAAIVRRLTSEGATVVGLGRNEERLAETAAACTDGSMLARVCDVRQPAECDAAVKAAVAAYGRLDVLINAAGAHISRITTDVTPDQWHDDIATNLSGPFFLSAAAIPNLLETNGNIVNVSSLAGHEGQPYAAGYCAAKHGIIGLTRSLAIEYTHTKLRVNVVCPGGMMTPQVHNFSVPDGVDFDLVMRAASPRGMMEPEDVASVVAFVASDDAGSLHGSVIMADNGKSVG